MYLGRVVGTCVASEKAPGLAGVRLLVVEPVDSGGRPTGGARFVAADTVSAGPGEVVFLVGAREAALSLDESFVPVDAAIVGLVDETARGDEKPGFLRGRDEFEGGPR
ncbi:MAG: EutN/CcmL family microcompartment protein [Myxococcales bacterium]|nr:EutN/CcmL family microcompartment protein [Myxococcales bacterium]